MIQGKKAQRAAGTAAVANSDAIMADIMAEIEGRAPAKSAAEFAAQNVSMPDAAAPKAAKANVKKAAKAAPADVSTPASEAFMKRAAEERKAEKIKVEKAAPAPAKAAAPPATEAASKPAATKTKARAAPMFEEEPFVPPAMYLSKQAPEPTIAEQKAKIRQEQMAKAAEAEARKKQQAERKTKKAEKVRVLTMPLYLAMHHAGWEVRVCLCCRTSRSTYGVRHAAFLLQFFCFPCPQPDT